MRPDAPLPPASLAQWLALAAFVAVSFAAAAWLVWRDRGFQGARLALALFAVQLALNALWSILFFGLKSPGAALVEIAFLWAAIFATMAAFWRVRPLAGWLFVPYLWWVT